MSIRNRLGTLSTPVRARLARPRVLACVAFVALAACKEQRAPSDSSLSRPLPANQLLFKPAEANSAATPAPLPAHPASLPSASASVAAVPSASPPDETPRTATPHASAAVPEAAPARAASDADLPLLDAAGAPLPQTDTRPQIDATRFQARIRDLADAILNDTPESAFHTFFPLVAYQQVKAIAKPERDYKFRLLRAFERDIHAYHAKLSGLPQPRLVGVEIPEKRAAWMKPGSEGNRVGYYRVLRSQLIFTSENGKRLNLELTSLISWRGEWYVVHLNGFK